MMKYRGPKDQHTIVERKYILRLVVGLAIVGAGVAVSFFGVALSKTTVSVPNPAEPGAGDVEVQAPVNPNSSAGGIALIAGTVVNLWAISKYRGDYSEIKDKEPRPEGMLVGMGLLLTVVALVFGGYAIFSL